jgi:hypothetical protein
LFWLMDYNGIMAIDANLIINDNMQWCAQCDDDCLTYQHCLQCPLTEQEHEAL